MAILTKIRKLPIILIVVIIGLPLLTFVADPSALKDFFSSNKINTIAEVGGEPISRNDFVRELEAYKKQVGGRVSDIKASRSVLNSLVRSKVYNNQLSEAGVTIGEADILKYIYEANFVKQDPRFQTAGIFDRNKLKQHLATIKENGSDEWSRWKEYMLKVKSSLAQSTYENLVSTGLGASLKEGESKYLFENTKISGDIVYVPYTSIVDSLVIVDDNEISAYVKQHSSEFKVDASRDIEFVRFDVKPTDKDEADLKLKLAKLLEDREEYNSAAKANVKVEGLKSTTDYNAFFIDNKSDLQYDSEKYTYKSELPAVISTKLIEGDKGAVFGPFKDKGFVKIAKIIDVVNVPDTVKARHILIPYLGSRAAKKETTQTEEQAKKTIDSLLSVVKSTPSKFNELAKKFSTDSSSEKGGDLGYFAYNSMVPEFRDYCFGNSKGDVGVVKSIFGFHLIKIDDQKNIQRAYKLAAFGQKIEASEETENNVFETASLFEQELANGKKFSEIAKGNKLKVLPAVGLKALSENVPGLGDQRSIVNWVFEEDVKIGDYKRFDIQNGYAVAVVTDKTAKGLMPVKKAISKVRPILIKEKKTEQILAKMTGNTIEEIANSTKTTLKKVSDVNLRTPTISGVGYEPNVVGAMLYAKENNVLKGISGNKGVFAVKVTSRKAPKALENYDTERKRIKNSRKNKSYAMYEALKKSIGVEDNLSNFYGIKE